MQMPAQSMQMQAPHGVASGPGGVNGRGKVQPNPKPGRRAGSQKAAGGGIQQPQRPVPSAPATRRTPSTSGAAARDQPVTFRRGSYAQVQQQLAQSRGNAMPCPSQQSPNAEVRECPFNHVLCPPLPKPHPADACIIIREKIGWCRKMLSTYLWVGILQNATHGFHVISEVLSEAGQLRKQPVQQPLSMIL